MTPLPTRFAARATPGRSPLIGADTSAPYDRPNLSKDYLAGTASEEWIPLRAPEFYEEREIRLLLGSEVTAIDAAGKRIVLDDGTSHQFGALLLATGSSPVHLPVSVADARRVHYLRTLADSRAIIAAATGADSAVVLGASFIGLEVAASLRARGLEVHVVAPEANPLERVMGRDSAISFEPFTKRTASRSTWDARQAGSMREP